MSTTTTNEQVSLPPEVWDQVSNLIERGIGDLASLEGLGDVDVGSTRRAWDTLGKFCRARDCE